MEYSRFSYIAISLSLLVLTKLLFSFTTKNNTSKHYPPSPPSLPIVGHLHHLEKPLHQSLARLSSRYGPIFSLRFGSHPVLVVSSLSLAHECFTTNDIAFANRVQLPSTKHRSFNYSALGAANYGPHWRNIRRILVIEVLSSHRLDSFISVRTSEVHEMMKRLFRESNRNGVFTKVELKTRLFEFMLNNTMRMVAGKRYGGDYGNSSSEEEVRKFQETVEGMFMTEGASNIGNFLPVMRWVDWKGMKREVGLGKYWNEFLQGIIDEIRSNHNEKENREKSMIGVLLSLQETDPDYYSDHIIKAIISSIFSAGTDTSAGTIEWTMSLLLNNPDKLAKAQEEINQHIRNSRFIQESDLSSLPYLQSVITEALRLYPAGPLLVPHESAQECVVGGFNVPSGTMLLVNAYSIHRDPNTWSEPEKFMPERFERAEMHQKLLPFGMGRRRCPGEGLAQRVVGLVLGALIQCFEWERVGKELVDMREGTGLTLPKAVPLEAMYRTRETMECVISAL